MGLQPEILDRLAEAAELEFQSGRNLGRIDVEGVGPDIDTGIEEIRDRISRLS